MTSYNNKHKTDIAVVQFVFLSLVFATRRKLQITKKIHVFLQMYLIKDRQRRA